MNITPLGWVGIIVIVAILLVLNLGLFALLRNPTAFKINRPPRTGPGINVHKLGEVLRDPFAEENRQMNELSHLVENLKDPKKGKDE
jgi:hypothetical protein